MDTVTRTVKIQNLKGLHARATAAFVKVAETFRSDISVEKQDGQSASGKSIMGLLMLAVPLGDTIKITAEGEDAGQAVEALSLLVDNRFGEVF